MPKRRKFESMPIDLHTDNGFGDRFAKLFKLALVFGGGTLMAMYYAEQMYGPLWGERVMYIAIAVSVLWLFANRQSTAVPHGAGRDDMVSAKTMVSLLKTFQQMQRESLEQVKADNRQSLQIMMELRRMRNNQQQPMQPALPVLTEEDPYAAIDAFFDASYDIDLTAGRR
jgi:hypothetical protein